MAGSMPPDHQPVSLKPGGFRRVRLHQIWVDRRTDEFWSIARFPPVHVAGHRRYTLKRYGGYSAEERLLDQLQLEKEMQVLEEAIAHRRARRESLQSRYDDGEVDTGAFPDVASYIRSFGFDPETGFRID
ncbi:MAG: hypothetical protein WAT81_00810 [Candidatus Moraniibacteriota bacterium]